MQASNVLGHNTFEHFLPLYSLQIIDQIQSTSQINFSAKYNIYISKDYSGMNTRDYNKRRSLEREFWNVRVQN